jgi:hypothetical protein
MIDVRQITIRRLRLDSLGKEGGGNPNHDERGRFAPSGGSSDTQEYRGMEIDAQLDPKQMDRLNAIPGIFVTSTCAGHPSRVRSAQRAGDSLHADVTFRVPSRDPEATYEKYRNALSSDDTSVGGHAWGTRVRGVVWADDEGWRRLPEFGMTGKPTPVDETVISVSSSIRSTGSNLQERHDWWDRTLDKLERI